MASIVIYGTLLEGLLKGDIALDDGTVGLLLTTTINAIDHSDSYVSDVLATETELVHASYSRQTQAVSASNVSRSGSAVTYDLANVVFPTLSGSNIELGILYKATGTGSGGADTSRRVIGYVDLDGPISLSGSDVTIEWNASGAFRIS